MSADNDQKTAVTEPTNLQITQAVNRLLDPTHYDPTRNEADLMNDAYCVAMAYKQLVKYLTLIAAFGKIKP